MIGINKAVIHTAPKIDSFSAVDIDKSRQHEFLRYYEKLADSTLKDCPAHTL